MSLKRLTLEETKMYRKLNQDDPRTIKQAVAFTLTPVEGEPGWEEVTYYGEGIMDPTDSVAKPEFVYVLVNEGIPGICKIGMTTTSVSQRVKEINSATGVITPWFSVYSYRCMNSRLLESEVHHRLQNMGHRVNPKREGFEVPSKTAISVIEEIANELKITKK